MNSPSSSHLREKNLARVDERTSPRPQRIKWTEKLVSPPSAVQEGGETVVRTVIEQPQLIRDFEEAGPSWKCGPSESPSSEATEQRVFERSNDDQLESQPREKDEKPSAPKTAGDTVAGCRAENRKYIRIAIGGRTYRALFDPGAMCTLFGPVLTERFRGRLEKTKTTVKGATGERTQIAGTIKMRMEIDGHEDCVRVRALDRLDHDVILGMDFCYAWDIDARLGRGLWRSREGQWREFDDEANEERVPLVAECAGISELKPEEKREIEETVERILQSQREEGLTNLTEHHIAVDDETPVKHHPRRMSPKMWQVAHDEVERMHREGIIEQSASDWCSAPVIVKKSDGSYRFCIDFRDLNKKTKKDAYPIPSIDAILDKLRKARYISTIDLRQAYFQVPMAEMSKRYTAFAVPGSGLWQFKRMPFGLTNAPMTFQRLVDALFGPEYEP